MTLGKHRRRMLPGVLALALLAGGAPLAIASPPHQDAGIPPLWAVETSGLAASDEYRAGTWIHTDYVFDDKGPNTNGSPGGDSSYPSGHPYNRNGADLVEVRLRPEKRSLELGVRLNTLLDPQAPIVAIGIDTGDGGAAGAAHEWPFGAGVGAEGVRYVVTLRAPHAVVTDLVAGSTTTLPLTVEHDTPDDRRQLENTLSTSIPLSALGFNRLPREGTWRVFAAAGIRDGDEWRGAPYDLAFVADEQWGNWQQNVQADIIAGGDLTPAVGTLHLGRFPEWSPPTATGRQTRIFRSRLERQMGEGIEAYQVNVVDGISTATAPIGDRYLGLFLPYGAWVPEHYDEMDGGVPLFLEMHGAGGDHLGLGMWADGSIDVPALAVSPLGRGGFITYKAEGEVDVLEAMADAIDRYRIDEDRVFASGISLGGVGTYNIAGHHPDLFAAAIPLIGTGNGEQTMLWPLPVEEVKDERVYSNRMIDGLGREILENTLNVPFRVFAGVADPLVPPTYSEGDAQRFEALGYDYQYSLFLAQSHTLVPPYINVLYHQVLNGCTAEVPGCDSSLENGGHVRDVNPARVVYKTFPFHEFPELDITYRGAYWVSGLEVRDRTSESAYGLIDARSHALAHKERRPAERLGPDVRVFGPTNDPYRFQGRQWAAAPEQPTNAATIRVENLAAATLDLDRMGITRDRLSVTVTGDGPSRLVLTGFSDNRLTVLRGGQPHHDWAVTTEGLVLRGTFSTTPATFEISRS